MTSYRDANKKETFAETRLKTLRGLVVNKCFCLHVVVGRDETSCKSHSHSRGVL